MYKILALDDSSVINSLVKLSLDTVPDIQVDATDSPETAIKMLDQQHYDLFIVDYVMPNIDGIEFISKAREQAQYQDTPIFILSANADEERKQQAKNLHVTGWINKPFQPQTLIKLVQKTLEREN